MGFSTLPPSSRSPERDREVEQAFSSARDLATFSRNYGRRGARGGGDRPHRTFRKYPQVKVNGLRALPDGLAFPVRNGYVTVDRVVKEGAIGTVVYGGVLYAVNTMVNRQ